MAWGRKKPDTPGYTDNAALGAFGGYEPSKGYQDYSATPSPSFTPEPTPEPAPQRAETPHAEPQRAEPQPVRPAAPRRVGKKRASRKPWLGFVLVLVVLGIVRIFGGGTHHTSTSKHTPSTYTPSPRVSVPPSISGWHSVAGGGGSYAYDVPPNWKPEPTTYVAWKKTAVLPGIGLVTTGFLDEGFCPGTSSSERAGSGVASLKVADAGAAAHQALDNLAVSRYSPDNGPLAPLTFEPPQDAQVDLAGKTRPARLELASVTATDTQHCMPKHALAGAIAIASGDPAKPQSSVLVVYADQDVPDAPSRDDVLRILHSFRGPSTAERTTYTPAPTTR